MTSRAIADSSSMQKSQSAAHDGIVIRECRGLSEFEACIQIERAAWKSADIDVVPLPLFVVAAETGGQVLGAFRGREFVGFTMAVAGWRNRKPFLHSHMTAVLEPYRDQGVGRRLKLFQRQDALARGITLVEWTFDPLVAKNAYFNLMRLGVIVRSYVPNAYGITTSPLYGALPTDRLVAEWHLRSTRVRKILAGRRATPAFSKNIARIAIPDASDVLKMTDSLEAAHLQNAVRAQFMRWFAKGYAATAVERTSLGMDYILEPWKE